MCACAFQNCLPVQLQVQVLGAHKRILETVDIDPGQVKPMLAYPYDGACRLALRMAAAVGVRRAHPGSSRDGRTRGCGTVA